MVSPYDNGVTTPSAMFGPECDRLSGTGTAGTARPAAAAISQNPRLTVFSSAMSRSNQADRIDHLIGATVFAPTDDAFAKYRTEIGPARYDDLMADPARLASLVDYHVIDRRYDRDGLLAETHGVATLYGGTLLASQTGDTIALTDGTLAKASILCGNIPTANATVFLIDSVLSADPNRVR
jgi:uncharacterized surface protein with fasciclin (FAS1) repeats